MTENQTSEEDIQQEQSASQESVDENAAQTSSQETTAHSADDLEAALADADAARQVTDLEAEIAEAKASALRAQAELENFRKRVRREQETESKFAALPLIGDLLPIVDNLQRAINASAGNEAAAGVLEGVTMVAKQLTAMLEKHGCKAVNPEGEMFDPNLHEAIAQHPSADHEPGTVAHVAQIGYQLHDRVIRPAQVVVTSAPPEETAEEPIPEA